MRLRESVACWELKFLRLMTSPSCCPQMDYKCLDALRVSAREGRGGGSGEEEEGAGGRRRGGRGLGPGVREAVVEGGGGSG